MNKVPVAPRTLGCNSVLFYRLGVQFPLRACLYYESISNFNLFQSLKRTHPVGNHDINSSCTCKAITPVFLLL